MSRLAILLGAGNAALAILFGAFAAHALRNSMPEKMLSIFSTAVEYHLYHALGLVIVGLLIKQRLCNRFLNISVIAMLFGIIIFCGSLYLLSLTGKSWLGVVTPFGGVAFIASWISVALGCLSNNRISEN